MSRLALFQMFSNLMYYSLIGYPVIIMMVKAIRWQKENERNVRLEVYKWIFFVLLIQSPLWERSLVSFNYMVFGIIPILLLFSYQKKDYEPSFTWTGYLGNHKVLIVIFFILLIGQWPMSRLVAGELLTSHHDWVEISLEDNRYYESYNASKLASYEGEIKDYLTIYDHDTVTLHNYTGTQISYWDHYKGIIVSIHYRLVGARWELSSIDLIEPLK